MYTRGRLQLSFALLRRRDDAGKTLIHRIYAIGFFPNQAPGRCAEAGCLIASSGGRVILLPGQSPAEEFAPFAHQIAHLCGGGIYVALQAKKPVLGGVAGSDGHIIFVN